MNILSFTILQAIIDWGEVGAVAVSVVGVLIAVKFMTWAFPILRQSYPWSIPLIAILGPAGLTKLAEVAAVFFGHPVDFGPLIDLLATGGALAVVTHQVYKQSGKGKRRPISNSRGGFRRFWPIFIIGLMLPAMASAQTIRVEPTQISLGGGAMIGDDFIVTSWDSVFAAVHWHGVEMFEENVTSGVGLEIHPAAVLSFTEDGIRVQDVDQVDWRLWSLNRVKMSALQLPGSVWDSMFIGTDLLIYEGGSTDFTGDFSARLVYGVKEKAGPGWIDLEIYMFEKYRPVSFAMFYRYEF